jgi:AmmeMemoRadiSam system protein B
MNREPVVAGQFYPGTKANLEKALSSLTSKKKERKKVLGAVSPHAGYVYSGAVAGDVISRLMPKELFVIIGPNHTGMGKEFSVFTQGAWKTPLGSVEVDRELADRLIHDSKLFKADDVAHSCEHSVEVQVPFLQYLMSDFKILPLCIANQDINKLKEAGKELAKAIKDLKRDSTIIASSDMTHYEAHETAKTKDMQAISAILHMDENELWEKVTSMNISMCGVAPVIMTLSATKAIGAKKAELVDYKTSGDTSGDYSSVVGYGGVIIT